MFIQQASGTTFLEINRSTFKRIKLVLPSSGILDSFTQTIRPVMMEVHALSQKNQNLRKTRDLLLPKLISGRLDVEELDIKGI
jgi:type I restriction enzyme S subunit